MSTANTTSLLGVPVRVEHSSGNIEPLLHEIRHALGKLLSSGDRTCIDLAGLPLAPGEQERIMSTLGQGEVVATITASGRSEIAETLFAGVWMVSHIDEHGKCRSRCIDVTWVPDLLPSQKSDVAAGLVRLNTLLGTS
ncbi:MAG TPA: hydrogenase expression/formation C-terminal domain-containing protein [Steroidobacteraceae bacterium]